MSSSSSSLSAPSAAASAAWPLCRLPPPTEADPQRQSLDIRTRELVIKDAEICYQMIKAHYADSEAVRVSWSPKRSKQERVMVLTMASAL